TLADALTRRGSTVTRRETGAAPGDAAIADAVARAAGQDAVVVTTMKAWTSAAQRSLVSALQDTGKPVVVVATRDPYDIAHLAQAPTYLATYSYSPVAIEAAARVITGEVGPSGRLPVDIPAATDPDRVLFAFGHGLGY
ncbi:MAG TPA: glycoside hydrolase family 3 C-terminal domain-containing protein, partial [Pedococcus sp.]